MYIRTTDGFGELPRSYVYSSFLRAVTVAGLASGLTNLVFWARHPRQEGQMLTPNTKEAAEWSNILKNEVKPALHNSSTERRIGQLIFFSRHPDILGHFKDQLKHKQETLSKEFEDIQKNIVRPWLLPQIARGRVNSRTIYVIDNDAFQSLPGETRTIAGNEIATQFAFVNGNAPMTVIFLNPGRFPEEFNFSDAVIGVTDPMTPPSIHVYWALKQQVNNLNRALDAQGSRQRFPAPDRTSFNPDRYGFGSMNKFVTSASAGRQVAAPLMTSVVNVNELIDFLNNEHAPSIKDNIPKDRTKWTDEQKKRLGIALGRAMAHEVRHLYVRTPIHSAGGLGSDAARLFGPGQETFSAADRVSIQSSITALEGQQGNRPVAASFAAAERSLDFPF